jgi:alpha-L-rhamnosidase
MAYVKYSNRTPYGDAGISWRNGQGAFQINVTVPVGCQATVHVPTNRNAEILEGDRPAGQSRGVELLRTEDDQVVYRIQSGEYAFTSR